MENTENAVLITEQTESNAVLITGRCESKIVFGITCRWQFPMVLNTLLILIYSEKFETYKIVYLKDIRDVEFGIDKRAFSGPLVFHFYGLATKIFRAYKYEELTGYATTQIEFSVPNCFQEVIFTNQSNCVFLGRRSIPQAESVDIGLLHKPPSWYGVSLIRTISCNAKIVFLQFENSEICIFFDRGSDREFILPFSLKPSRVFRTRVITATFAADANSNHIVFWNVKFSNLITFQAYYTITEYMTLYQYSIQHRNNRNRGVHPIKYLYRNKPKIYFDWIFQHDNGIMLPYKKDLNGDQCSIINGNIHGLFFSTWLDLRTKEPPFESFFGEIRLHVDILHLFKHECNLYFADFYCHYHVHYVTLLLTPQHSPVDDFCRDRLMLLDKFNNPFMFLKSTCFGLQVFVDHNVNVEVFYTEPIDIPLIVRNNLGFISDSIPIGRGSSKLLGIPKNKECSICNLNI